MDAAKIMWVMYEHPEVAFEDLALRFMDIRKRIATIDDLRCDIYEWMDTRPVEDMFAYVPWITAQMERVAATVTQSTPAGTDGPKV